MIPIGVSISDLALAVKVIHKVCSAFRDANGADQQYAATVTFLDAFARTFERMVEYAGSVTKSSSSSGDDVRLSDDLTAQMRLIYAEYVKFDDYLKKVEPGLSSRSITSRVTARAKWAIRELSEKVDGLKKDVIAPMMLVTPLLAVEVLRELKEIRAQLPATESYEAAIRQNSKLILQTNSDIAHLRANVESWWWNRRWAMSAIEEDVKTLKLVVKQNTDLIESSRTAVQASVSQATQRQAASNIETITVLETVMAGRLNSIEAQIDQLICDNRLKTGKDDRELASIKLRLAKSRTHLQKAATSARQCLNSFGLLVIAVDDVHKGLVPLGMVPFAKKVIGYCSIFQAGQNLVKHGGEAVEQGGKCMQENDILGPLKSWNPFGTATPVGEKTSQGQVEGTVPAAVREKKELLEEMEDDKTAHPPREVSPLRTRAPTLQDEGYDSGDEVAEKSAPAPAATARPVAPPTTTGATILLPEPPPPYPHNLLDLNLDAGLDVSALPAPIPARKYEPSARDGVPGLDDNPWA